MARPLPEMSDAQIDAEIENHDVWRNSGKPYTRENAARYEALLQARGERDGLRFDISIKAIETAAREGKFLSYGDIAEANGVPWSKAYRPMGAHLWTLVKFAHERGLPMLSAIVVNKPNLATGAMETESLAGFLRAAEALGFIIDDPETFLGEQQRKVFEAYEITGN